MSLLTETPLFEDLFEERVAAAVITRVAAAEQARLLAEQERSQTEEEKFRAEKELFQIEKELFQIEKETFQAEKAKFEAEQKAARYAARLRELGIDPDQD